MSYYCLCWHSCDVDGGGAIEVVSDGKVEGNLTPDVAWKSKEHE